MAAKRVAEAVEEALTMTKKRCLEVVMSAASEARKEVKARKRFAAENCHGEEKRRRKSPPASPREARWNICKYSERPDAFTSGTRAAFNAVHKELNTIQWTAHQATEIQHLLDRAYSALECDFLSERPDYREKNSGVSSQELQQDIPNDERARSEDEGASRENHVHHCGVQNGLHVSWELFQLYLQQTKVHVELNAALRDLCRWVATVQAQHYDVQFCASLERAKGALSIPTWSL